MPEPPTETVNHGDIQHFGIPAFHPSKHSTLPNNEILGQNFGGHR